MDPLQLTAQFGGLGVLLFVIYKLGIKWIDKWSAAEAERTKAITAGFQAITESVNSHAQTDLASHSEMTEAIGHFEGRLDQILVSPLAVHSAR